MASRQIYENKPKVVTKQIRIGEDLHRQLKIKSCADGESMKALLEDALAEILSPVPRQ